jgi:hypothetical protein
VSIDEFPHLQRWLSQLEARPALIAGASVPHQTQYTDPDHDSEKAVATNKGMISK